ncbi:response regulator [Vitiosangium sp. GDMCC 1.1324]|uniref:response regulator n=1 Tax=Vitiosangium sp. (strain GDMCC 1.1324) TaxID=2138576 RepID=UPI000D396609|nr:response regulator [Vitiosangium sp. GDMCC 1.1324]PTL76217.1 hybrid sensor histidine kinase/response regulator [Vitiosangium sp. GDMCC 1.1324]
MSSTTTLDGRPATILIVDDTPANLGVAVDHLELMGYRVLVAQDGEEALERAEHMRPDIILLDVVMPGLDGLETCRRLKKAEGTREIPVIFMTCLSDAADKLSAFEAGGVDFVTKPFQIEELIARTRVHLALREAQKQLEAKNAQLQQEIATRREKEAALRRIQDELEQRVQERTAALANTNTTLKAEISDRQRVEEALRESQRLLQAIIDNSTAVISVKDVEGRYLLTNRRFLMLFHLTRESVLGKTDYDLFPRVNANAFRAFDQRVMTARKALEAEELMPQDDGLHTYISIKCPLQDESGRPYAICGISTDISERKRIEEEREVLLASERTARGEVERTSRMKDEFLTTLSHELRTPLTSILGWAQLILSRHTLTQDLRRGLETIARNARAQAQLIDDLLDMSRIVSGRLRLDVRAVSPASVLEAVVESLKPAADAKAIRLEQELDPAVGQFLADPNRLQQIAWNLVSNAIKFTPQGGRVKVALSQQGPNVQLTVSDTGIGIEPDFLPHVFEPFRQADASSTRRHGGLGMGLAIVLCLVELHGGTVEVASEGKDQGASFTVKLPRKAFPTAARASRTPATHRRRASSDLSGKLVDLESVRVLVVDDEPDTRELIGLVLAEHHAEVRTVGSAAEALAELARFRPMVLVSDIGMPEEDGYSLIQKVRRLPRDQGGVVPALALTAFARAEDRTRAILEGYQMHLAKPVEPLELMTYVASLAGRTYREAMPSA